MSSRKATRENADIRAWARNNGVELGPRGRIPDEVRAGYWEENGAPGGDENGAPGGAPDGAVDELERLEDVTRGAGPAPSEGGAPELPATGETAPVERGRRKLWSAPERAKTARRRESLAQLATFLWGGMAQAAGRQGRIPTQRMLALQAPVAGIIADDVL